MLRNTLVLACLVVGCTKQSEKYCATHDDPRCGPAADAPVSCTDNTACEMLATTPFCDVPNMTCVECRDSNDCRASAPVCGSDKACHGCTQHSECPADACLPDGTCGTSENVAYVEAGGHPGPCDIGAPCDKVADALLTAKPFIKITGDRDEAVSIASGTVTLLAAPNARLRTGGGVILEVRTDAHVSVYDLTLGTTVPTNVTCVSMPAGTTGSLDLHRVKVEHCSAATGAINVVEGTFTLDRSIVSENLGGGLSIGSGAQFTIRNNFIIENGKGFGSGQSTIGGALITGSDTVAKQFFEYNTVANNGTNGTLYRGGATCTGSMVSAIGNLFYGNAEANTSTDTTQHGGTCGFGNSFAKAMVAGNLGFDLTTTPGNYHIGPAAADVLDVAGDCTASTRTDIDGEDRPFGTQCDLGADEYHP